jgi:phospho-N-acetylmuramoyl-pentapeptide-transferase
MLASIFDLNDWLLLRAALACFMAWAIALVLGRLWIERLGQKLLEPIQTGSEHIDRLHSEKSNTPSMGGLFVIASLCLAFIVWMKGSPWLLAATLVVSVGLTALGTIDDLIKIKSTSGGLSWRTKLISQAAIGCLGGFFILEYQQTVYGSAEILIPLADWHLNLGWSFIPWAALVIVAGSNGVNLTDGLDGLAGGCLLLTTASLAIGAWLVGSAGSEALVLIGSLIGALVAFVWFNRHPARVFLGDAGSLPLGGLLGLIALALRLEILLFIVGGVFVVETLSVLMQVGSYKLRRKRVFLCAPLHHHFQFLGWSERKIVRRFWAASIICAVAGLMLFRMGIVSDIDMPLDNQTIRVAAEPNEANEEVQFAARPGRAVR